jgi:hypothetical protein
MKKNLLAYFSATLFMLLQGCSKNNSETGTARPAAIPVHYAPKGESLKINGTSDHGTFQLISVSTGKSSEIANLSLADGGTSDLAAFTGIAHQVWRIWDAGNGYFRIMNDGSGKYIQSYLYAGIQQLIQVFKDTISAQMWSITSTGNGYYKCINKATGLAITAPADTGEVTLAAYTDKSSQWWTYNQFADQTYRDDYVVNFFHRQHGSISFDQGNSIPLSNGSVVWVTEDTYTQYDNMQPNGEFPCGWFFNIHNSLLLQPASHSWDESQTNNITTTNSPYQFEVLASPGNHNATETWPGVGVEVGDHVYMYAYEGPQQNGFNDVVIYDFTEGANGSLNWGTAVRHAVPGVSDQDSITYAEGFIKPGDGYVYAYGSVNVFLDKELYLARFAEGSPFVWTFWDGKEWAARPTTATAAQVQFVGGNAVEANTTGSYVNGKWVMMQMDLGYFCDNTPHNIYMSTSNSPLGPFTAKQQIFTIEDMINGHLCNYYTPSVHPEFINGENELLLTYCLNYTACDVSTCTNGYLDPNFYQLKAVRVPYAEVGL